MLLLILSRLCKSSLDDLSDISTLDTEFQAPPWCQGTLPHHEFLPAYKEKHGFDAILTQLLSSEHMLEWVDRLQGNL